MASSYKRSVVKYQANSEKEISYISAGPSEGQLLIFLHGWPGIAYTWKPQIETFAALGFLVVAPDMPGYGESTSTKVQEDYSHENIIPGLLALLEATTRTEAVWLAHDWGAGVLSTLMATHPEVIKASCLMAVPYRTLELGLEEVVKLVNREMYPEDKFPFGQWDYQNFYEQSFDKATEWFDANVEPWLKVSFSAVSKGRGALGYGKPAFTATVTKDGGWFGGIPKALPEWNNVPTEGAMLGQDVLEELIKAMKKTGFYGPDSYYMNHKRNREFNLSKQKNGGHFEKPLLFIEPQWDSVCDTANSRLADPMRQHASKLTWTSIAAGHWVSAEAPQETNAAIAKWLATEVADYWPYFYKNAQIKNY
ncbi:alpha/beta-hydrolase [Mollisia scopiformis]|uniref:Alpha/beta-hydrolase n=1 Tax=Mollisia scopiformis TaxID=149040 RepID=A0A194XGK1_MOLSC|nr:alpha/beta-hydrolase [Mollisia scopiformis]KUJ18902.1 alpha/beta-hydrolase [Mollisia scopiformis]